MIFFVNYDNFNCVYAWIFFQITLSNRKGNGMEAGGWQYFWKEVNFEAAADNFPTVLFIIFKN